jgi:hypothetical protein
MLRRTFVGLLMATAAGGLAFAQAKKKGPNGGSMTESEGHTIEFVNKGSELVFYLGDHDGGALPTKGIKGRAIVQEGGKTKTIQLAPATPNLLVGKLEAPLAPKTRVAFSAAVDDHNLQGRFVVE